MNYEEGTFREAFILYQTLIQHKEITKKKHPEIYRSFFTPKVREVIQNVIQRDAQVIIFHLDETIYLVPELENELLTYSNEELRTVMKLSSNKELYLAQFIWINVLSEFYGEQFQFTNEPRNFVKVEEILHTVEAYITGFKQFNDEKLTDLAACYEMDLEGLIEVWDGLMAMTEGITDVRRAVKRDYGFLLKALRFWENEKLIYIHNNEEIVLTEKMKNITAYYYHHEERIHRIKELLRQTENFAETIAGGDLNAKSQ
jgi:hypothetical protein